MRPGDTVLLRSVYRARVRWAFPHALVTDDCERVALHLAPGNAGVLMDRDEDGRYLERWARGDDPRPHVWNTHHILWLARRADAHMLGLYWDERWDFRGEDWRPDPTWPVPELPAGWDSVGGAVRE